ncbi:methyl-accepting chemotaxis protein [Paenibacillus agricola]|uniref:Methyl-accepting chemotaxis protein n=1 Tax=Paenibacillus agricola TaxID=2716264 RepID=A0ABX0JB56_9BACL|nr:HAMP domain-containing methyl-accepting chemotaxis protein [Paenibacillus agricola]NHN33644.1 methyl-accepting chemotaxis protein [Paenibacillus agricola]
MSDIVDKLNRLYSRSGRHMLTNYFKLTVGKKMFLSYLVLLFLLCVLGGASLNNAQQMQTKTNEITTIWLGGTSIANNLNYLTEHVLALQYKILIISDASQKTGFQEEAKKTFLAIDEQFGKYEKTYANDQDQTNTEQLKEKWNKYKDVFNQAFEISNQVDSVNGSKKKELEVLQVMDQSQQTFNDMQKNLDLMVKINNDGAIQATKESSDIYAGEKVLVILLMVVSVLIGIVLVYIMNRIISKPTRLVSDALHKVAGGDLSIPKMKIKQKDEIGMLIQSLNEMVSKLKATMFQIQDASMTVAASSEQLLANSEQNTEATKHVALAVEQLALGSENQLQSANETSRATEEMAVGIQRIAETTSEVSELSLEASQQAQAGNETIQSVVGIINVINNSVGQAGSQIKLLESHSHNIGDIVKMIGDIASQTSLLALNAAIESARAGEHGRGFAIVANEVKKLAEQSTVSVQQITDLITQIQSDTLRAVHYMDQSLIEVKSGLEAVSYAEKAFGKIENTTQAVTEKVQEIAAAAQEMAAGSEQVSASVNEMSSIARTAAESTQIVAASTEEQLASVEEITSSAQSLSIISQSLSEIAGQFKV